MSQGTGWWFAFRRSELLVLQNESGIEIPAGATFPVAGVTLQNTHQVGEVDGTPCFAAELAGDVEPPAGTVFLGLRALYGKVLPALYKQAGRAVQIVDWDRSHRFCGRCGTPTTLRQGEWAMECPTCKELYFPRLSPAVIVLIRDGDRALLGRSHRFPPGQYSTLAGFVEPGETLEEAVEREVHEEVGVQLTNIRYFGSQPWPFPNSLMVGFTADYAGGEIRVQEEELADARWFRFDELPLVPPPLSIARRLIDWFVADCQARGDA
ncbi:MAG TPA: NAD(+) diphosphatase [Symbiobacteriaceae bacterium]|nr:NAD(+) diphosphatase [Symbiobacteriaceae bacterium]